MQDRFRFRVWNKDLYSTEPNPRMIYGVEHTYDCCCENDWKIPASSFGAVIDDEDFIPMQCTGIKDKNDKLIYENDIITCGDDRKWVVIWDDTFWQVKELRNDGGINVNALTWCAYEEIEVIGNIYENKELLEK